MVATATKEERAKINTKFYRYVFAKLGIKQLSKKQMDVLLAEHDILLVAGGERAGKSFSTSLRLLLQILRDMFHRGGLSPGNVYWLVGQTYEDTKVEYEFLSDWFAALGLLLYARSDHRQGGVLRLNQCPEHRAGINKCGCRPVEIHTRTGKEETKLVATAPKGILVCEASKLPLGSFTRLLGRATEHRAPITCNGTFDYATGWFVDRFRKAMNSKQWRREYRTGAISIASYDNLAIYPQGINTPIFKALRREYSQARWENRIMGIPRKPEHLVFPEADEQLHLSSELEFDEEAGEVVVCFDPGFSRVNESAYAVVAFQIKQTRYQNQIVVFDEIYRQESYGIDIVDEVMARPWWNKSIKTLVGDVAARQHHAGPSQLEIWQQKTGLTVFGEKVEIQAGIDIIAGMLKVNDETKEPGLLIHSDCIGIMSELGMALNPFTLEERPYSWGRDVSGNPKKTSKPEDRYNHSIKALYYGIVHALGYGAMLPQEERKPVISRMVPVERPQPIMAGGW